VSFLVDANVLSEVLRARPEPAVLAWLAGQPSDRLYVSAVTQAEMLLGARLLPPGRRRASLEAALQAMFEHDFAERVLPFDSAAAREYVEVVAARRSAGRPIAQFDAQIAAIARRLGGALVTRNVADFAGCGLLLVDPWTDPAH